MNKRLAIAVLVVLVVGALVLFSLGNRSAYYHSAIWGSAGSITCPCYGIPYLASPDWVDASTWTNCIGYVDKRACECDLTNSTFAAWCNVDDVSITIGDARPRI